MKNPEVCLVYEVDVFWGDGGGLSGGDSIATYLVYAESEEAAEDLAIGQSSHLINAKANVINNMGPIDEIDYDGVLGPRKENE